MKALSNFLSESIINEGKWSNYYDDHEPEGQLAAYIYDANVGFLSSDTLTYLKNKYPNKKKVLAYRGLHFSTREKYLKFLDSIKNNRIKLGGYSSWTRNKSTAIQFALTKPTNNIMFLGQEFFKAESDRRKAKDYTQGFGVILKMVINPNMGLDVNSVPHIGQENEIILPSGEYVVKVAKKFKPHRSGIKEIEDINEYIQKQRSLSSGKGRMMEFSMLEHILANYQEDLTDASRSHMFNMFSGGLNDPEWRFKIKGVDYFDLPILKVNPDYKKYRYGTGKNVPPKEELLNGKDQMHVEVFLANFNLNLLAYYDLFLDSDKHKIIGAMSKLGDQLIDKIQEVETNAEYDYFYNLQVPNQILDLMDPSVKDRIKYLLNHNVGKYYNKINSREEINKINNLSGEEQQKAIYQQIDQLKNLFKSLN